MASGRTCLVTGGAGFIGCGISSELTRRYSRVIAFDSLHPQVHRSKERPPALHPGVELVIGDVSVRESWDELLPRVAPDVVIHLAAETGTGQSLTEATRHANVNVLGTTQMLDGLARHEIFPSRIILCSSRAVYGEGAWRRRADGAIFYPGQRSRAQLEAEQWDFGDAEPLPFEATQTRPAPTSIYGATKLSQEYLLSVWAASFGSALTILRLQNVYGPGQSLINSYTGIVSLFARIARAKESIPLYEDGAMRRDFVFIEDVASAVLAALDDPASAGQTFDVGTGAITTIADVARIVAERYQAPQPHVCRKFRHGDVRHASCDVTRTRASLRWTPRHDLGEGLRRLCRWIDEQ